MGCGADVVSLALFVLDLELNFHQCFVDENGELVFTFSRIAMRYVLSPWFVVDLASCIPFGGVCSNANRASSSQRATKAAKFFKLMRMVRLGKMAKKMEKVAKTGSSGTRLDEAKNINR